MIKKLVVVLLTGVMCLIGVTSALAHKLYPTLTEYEKLTGKKIEKFSESPMLKIKVAAGELPPVEERLPEEPIVIEPFEEIGQYGGTLRSGATALESAYDMWWSRQYYLFSISVEKGGMKLYPHVPRGWDLSEDLKTLTIYLRKGLKWSDGAPYTADDIMFWYEDILLNDELTPTKPKVWSPGGELVKMEKVDDYTVRFEFATPYATVIEMLSVSSRPLISRPKHYLKKWHPNYNPEAIELAKEEGYDHWWKCFNFHAMPKFGQDVNLPTTFPWVIKEVTTTKRIYERNPYFWMVDTAGNQLPYIDGQTVKFVENTETLNLKTVAGDFDFAGLEISFENYPLYKKNEEEGGYETRLWKSTTSAAFAVGFNLTHKDPGLRKVFNDIRFRQAMSLAIDRDEINKLLYFGRAVVRQAVVLPTVSYYEPWMENYYAEYDPEKANSLLDEMELNKRDKEGFRLRPDGEPLLIILAYVQVEGPKGKVAELVKDYWKDVGVRAIAKEVQRELYAIRGEANELDVGIWHKDWWEELTMRLTNMVQLMPGWLNMYIGVPWATWDETNGKAGEEPPEEIKRLFKLVDEFLSTPSGTEKYMQLGKEILTINVRNLFQIGTVGMQPQPIIIKNTLKNIPNVAAFGGYSRWYGYIPPQWFFEK